MEVKFENFLFKPCEAAPLKWDVLEVKKKQKIGTGTKENPNGEFYDSIYPISYGVTIERAIEICINKLVEKENEGKKLALIEYLKEFTEKRERFENKN